MSSWSKITDRIVELVESEGVLPWNRPWKARQPINAVSGKPYKGVNRLVLSLSEYADPRWVTFKQAVQLGGTVKRGEKATQILFWSKAESSNQEETEQKSTQFFSRCYSVFNVLQCENLNLAPLPNREVCEDSASAVFGVIMGYENGPEVIFRGDVACYVPATDKVFLPHMEDFESDVAFAKVAFHELSHSSGAAHRLARPGVVNFDQFGSVQYSCEELIAEIGSAFICSELGIDNQLEQTSAYVASWLQVLKNDKSMIVKAACQAEKACQFILGKQFEQVNLEAA